jgi:hypothetical protein
MIVRHTVCNRQTELQLDNSFFVFRKNMFLPHLKLYSQHHPCITIVINPKSILIKSAKEPTFRDPIIDRRVEWGFSMKPHPCASRPILTRLSVKLFMERIIKKRLWSQYTQRRTLADGISFTSLPLRWVAACYLQLLHVPGGHRTQSDRMFWWWLAAWKVAYI